MSEGRQLTRLEDVRDFVWAGNATITLRSARTQARFTFKVSQSEDGQCFYVGVLSGPDNETSYQFMGTVFNLADASRVRYVPGKKSRIGDDAASSVAWRWFFAHLCVKNVLPASLEVWHEGKCGRCGRKLTVPESIERGIGPECVKHQQRRAA